MNFVPLSIHNLRRVDAGRGLIFDEQRGGVARATAVAAYSLEIFLNCDFFCFISEKRIELGHRIINRPGTSGYSHNFQAHDAVLRVAILLRLEK